MICTVIQNKTLPQIAEIVADPRTEMAEIRLDLCPLSLEDIEELFSDTDIPLVATCRTPGGTPKDYAASEARLVAAIRSGAAYVDLEIEAPAMMGKRIRREAAEYGTVLVRSFHDFEGTDSAASLSALVEKCLHLGAEVAKIVTTARSEADCERVLGLYDAFPPEKLIAFCMGDEGRRTRLDCLAKGAPYTYAALSEEEAVAPGQWTAEKMREALYGSFNLVNESIEGLPCSKSFAQRAIIAAALADGISVLEGYTPCGDNESAIAAARSLGASVALDGGVLTIGGIGGRGFTGESLHVGESGFLTRMMIPVLAGIGPGEVRITGEKTLLSRPLRGASQMLVPMGVALSSDTVPLTLSGRLRSGEYTIDGSHGSQLISGLLAALPLAGGDSVLRVERPKSLPYLFITLEVLRSFGIMIENEMEGGEEFAETQDWDLCEAVTFRIRGGQKYTAANLRLETDWSAAANFLVAGALFGRATICGPDTSSLQADLSIMDILAEAGTSLSSFDDLDILNIRRAPLRGFETEAGNCPDLFPILAVLAAFCQGRSKIGGVGRLATKECDRGAAILEMLGGLGVKASIKGDSLIVHGHSLSRRLLTGRLLRGGNFSSRHDHRMVMALEVASLGADGPVVIDDTACVAKSFPGFYEIFNPLRGQTN